MSVIAEELANLCGGVVRGEASFAVQDAQALDKAGPNDVTYVTDAKHVSRLAACSAGVVIIPEELAAQLNGEGRKPVLILVADAQAAFIRILQQFRPERPRAEMGVSSQAYVASSASIGSNTNVYPGAFIGDDVVLGDGCDIFPGVYIGPGCRLGDRVTIYPNAVLYPDVVVGNRVIIHAAAVLGADGFGYRFEEGRYVKIPQRGTVRIEDDVEIGACTTVDRGMIGPTVVGEGTKLDNLIMIAHNCELGKHNAFASQVGLAGSVTTDNYVRCAGQVGIADHVHLGEGCTLGAKAGVHSNMAGGETYLGSPARPKNEQITMMLAATKLPDMRKRLRQMESQITALTKQIEELTADSSEE